MKSLEKSVNNDGSNSIGSITAKKEYKTSVPNQIRNMNSNSLWRDYTNAVSCNPFVVSYVYPLAKYLYFKFQLISQAHRLGNTF